MPDSQQWYVLGNAVWYSFIHESAAVRFFEYAANSAGGERLRRGGVNIAHGAKPVTLFYWMKAKMSLVAVCFVLQKSL